jgi:hypothetical protein
MIDLGEGILTIFADAQRTERDFANNALGLWCVSRHEGQKQACIDYAHSPKGKQKRAAMQARWDKQIAENRAALAPTWNPKPCGEWKRGAKA